MATVDPWAALAGRFVEGHYGSLRGRVRTHVIDRQLRAHLPAAPCALVDVGGGAGHQSIPLARDGYQVTIIDPSPAMLDRARARLQAESGTVADRVRLVQASAEEAADAVGGQQFAGVLCHGVIMYVPDPRPFVAGLAGLARPGAVVSMVAKNARTLAVRPALEGKWAQARQAFEASHQVNGLGLDTRGDTLEDLTAILAGHGIERIAWYGVRLFTDNWTPQQAVGGAEDEIFAVEYEASRRDPYRLMSRLFHVVGQQALRTDRAGRADGSSRPTLRGSRVTIRPGAPDDVAPLRTVLADESVVRWWGEPEPADQIAAKLRGDDSCLLLVMEIDGQVAGGIQYDEEQDPMYRHAGIDIFLGRPYQDRGAGTEAVGLLARFLFEQRGHHRITIDPAAANQRAIRCYQKVGFRPVGVMRRYERGADGRFHDGLLMDLTRDDLSC